jgi:hypothetical protein
MNRLPRLVNKATNRIATSLFFTFLLRKKNNFGFTFGRGHLQLACNANCWS